MKIPFKIIGISAGFIALSVAGYYLLFGTNYKNEILKMLPEINSQSNMKAAFKKLSSTEIKDIYTFLRLLTIENKKLEEMPTDLLKRINKIKNKYNVFI